MELKFQQSEPLAARRRWILVLVDSSDGVTGLTGQSGTVRISKNGAASAASTNSLVEVDSSNMPGHYYVELTAGEVSDLGMISIYKKTASSLAFHDRAYVSYDDPFARHGGVASGPGGKGAKFTATQANDIAERVWKVKIDGDKTAAEVLIEKSDFDAESDVVMVDQQELSKTMETIAGGLQNLMENNEQDFQPILDAIANIENKDYSPELENMQSKLTDEIKLQVTSLMDSFRGAIPNLAELVEQFNDLMPKLQDNNSNALEFQKNMGMLTEQFGKVKETLDTIEKKVSQEIDIESRFANMNTKISEENIKQLAKEVAALQVQLRLELKNLLTALTNVKYDILEGIQ